MTYTKSYWTQFCKETIGKEIHHNPTKGGNTEKEKFSECYDSTFDLYRSEFGYDPLDSIWLDNKTRFRDINFKRINTNSFWLIKKPSSHFLNFAKLFLLVTVVPLLFMRAYSNSSALPFIIGVVMIFVIYYLLGRKNNGGGSGSSHGCSSHWDDSGCSSGCSGCGGCGD